MIKPVLRFGLLLWVLACLVLAGDLMGSRSDSQKALAKYKAELRAKGEKLSFQEIAGMLSEEVNDSHGILTNAVAKLRNSKVSPGSLELRKPSSPGFARVAWQQKKLPAASNFGGSVGTSWEDLETQINQNRPVLSEIRNCLKDPAPNIARQQRSFLQGPVPNFVVIRTASQWLSAALVDQLHQGKLDGALEDLDVLICLARFHRAEPMLVSQMIRIAVAKLAIAATWEALQASGWTDAQLEHLDQEWARVDLLEALEIAFRGERALGDELWADLRKNNGNTTRQLFRSPAAKGNKLHNLAEQCFLLPAYKITTMDDDELFRLQSMQKSLEALVTLRKENDWSTAKQSLQKTLGRVQNVADSWERIRYPLSLMSIPNMMRAVETGVHAETERRMTTVAIALKRFHLRNGSFPPNLEALVPQFLPAIPLDLMNGKPLCYRLNSDGSFALYSVGDNGSDDGGDASPVKGSNPDLWSGHDALWPSPSPQKAGSNSPAMTMSNQAPVPL